MFKKILAAVLATAAVLAFAACSEDEEKPVYSDGTQSGDEAVSTPVEEGDIDYDADLSTERYDGYNYRMFIPKGHMEHYDPEEEVGDIVTDAIF